MAILFSCTKLNEDSPNNDPSQEDNPGIEKITISVTNIEASSASLSITTGSSDTYYLGMSDKDTWELKGGDVIWNTSIDYLKQQGTLSQTLRTGNFSSQITDLDARTEYVIFAPSATKMEQEVEISSPVSLRQKN